MTTEAPVDVAWIVDASVALKWFLPRAAEPRADLARGLVGRLRMRTTSLAEYEVGNILTRRSTLDEVQVLGALELLREICGEPIAFEREDRQHTVRLARRHGLTFYDASYAAIATRTGRRLLSDDRDLIDPGLALALQDAPAN